MRIAACLVIVLLAGACAVCAADGVRGTIVADRLEYDDAPGGEGFAAGTIARGQPVTVRGREPGGWLAIEPPEGAFCWIDAEAIRTDEVEPERALVESTSTAVRTGREGARMPGPPRQTLTQGDVVRLVDRPALTLRQGGSSRRWVAIEPPSGWHLYVPARGVRLAAALPEPDEGRGDVAEVPDVGSIDSSLTSVGPPIPEGRMPPELASRLQAIEAEHRALLRRPMVNWQLALVRSRYQALLRQAPDPASQDVIQGHVDHATRQEAAAEAARKLEELLQRLGPSVAHPATHRDVEEAASVAAPFDAEGMFQKSSRIVRGQRVYALIGDEGHPIAYLFIPPGLEVSDCLSRRVGVRGPSEFDPSLRSRVITVTEIEALSPAP